MRSSKIKHFFFSLSFCFFASLVPSFPSLAADTDIYSIDIHVSLNQDGSADITELWDINMTEGTEWYLVQGNLGQIEIENFTVSDETGLVYKNEAYWDINRSLSEKAGKCGIVDKGNGNYELCFGIGSYGRHVFTVSYRMTNFMKGFNDYCGFNQRFVNDGLSSNPQQISVVIEKPGSVFTSDDVLVWAFGFEGSIYVKDGVVSASGDGPLSSDDYVNIMCRFPRDMFNTDNLVNDSFSSMEHTAKEGSSYQDSGALFKGLSRFLPLLIVFLIVLLILLAVVIVLAAFEHGKAKADTPSTFEESERLVEKWRQRRIYNSPMFWVSAVFLFFLNPLIGIIYFLVKMIRGSDSYPPERPASGTVYSISEVEAYAKRNSRYWRDLPLDSSVSAIYTAVNLMGINEKKEDLIGAYLLRWLQQGCVSVKKMRKSGIGGILGKEEPSLVLAKKPDFSDALESQLHSILYVASGGDHGDHILQKDEMYKWSKDNYTTIENWFKAVKNAGRGQMTEKGYMHSFYSPSYFNTKLDRTDAFTETGRQKMTELFGFKNYLKDFTLMQEREPADVGLWEDYLVTAQLFGMADRVAETFQNLYPEKFAETIHNGRDSEMFDMAVTLSILHSISHAGTSGAQSGASAAQASSGGGGSSSSSGGGGYSGGGHGGGGR